MVGERSGAKSNRDVVAGNTNKEKHETLMACETFDDLADAMCPKSSTSEGRYKLTLTECDGKLHAQMSFLDIPISHASLLEHLVRFSVHFVCNSSRFRQPKSLKPGRTLAEQIDFLFEHVIRDRVVEDSLVMMGDNTKESMLQDVDTTVVILSECMDGLSFIESVAVPQGNSNIPLGVFDDSLLDPDSQGVTRKRPRGVQTDGFVTVPSVTSNLDPLFGHDLEHGRFLLHLT